MYPRGFKVAIEKFLNRYRFFGVLFPSIYSLLSIIIVITLMNRVDNGQLNYFLKPLMYFVVFNIPVMVLILWLLITAIINFIDNIFNDLIEEKMSRLFFSIGYGFIFFIFSQLFVLFVIKNGAGEFSNIKSFIPLIIKYKLREINIIAFLFFSLWCVFVNKVLFKTRVLVDFVVLIVVNALYLTLNLFQMLWQKFSS